MPCLIISTNQRLESEDVKERIMLEVSAKVAELLGKPEQYVMTVFHDKLTMSMSGTTDPALYLELKSIGLPETRTGEFSKALCSFMCELLHVPTSRIYIEFTNAERHLWGWDNRTF